MSTRIISDNENINTNNNLPLKSSNNRRCLTKCYSKGTPYLHPVTLTGYKNDIKDTCAIDPVYSRQVLFEAEPSFEQSVGMLFIDDCKLDDNNIFQPPDELESILLSFYFNPTDFLINIYGLHSFDQVIYWTLENDYLPFDTVKRVHNCTWKAYGKKIEELSTTVLDYYYDMAKNRWLHDYIDIIQNKYSFNLVSDKIDLIDASKEIYDIISSSFFTFDFFFETIKKYISVHQHDWDMIDSHYKEIKNFIFQQLITNIEKNYENNKNSMTAKN